ncbi:MAG TPA: sensor histidine kinase N-terminal domain-containing protein [Burkholderiaceae bacterium]|nr:sensor histidine kinase N-terminal domain-containing protein [Burkholderiaceae bacterium]
MPDRHEHRSLFGEILDWMLAPLLLLWPMSVALTWLVAQGIANRPYDRELAQLAHSVAREVRGDARFARGLDGVRDLRLAEPTAALLRSDDVDRVWFQVRDVQGTLAGGDAELPPPADDRAAPDEVQFRDDSIHNDPVRVAWLWVGTGAGANSGIVVQVAETFDKRSRLATEIIKGVILPQFVILPLAVLLVWFALARGIAPLNALQQRIRHRRSEDLSPIDEHDVPEEVAPLVRSINDLLARLDQAISSQRHFLADAAHQMKTPLAGLRMQAELAQRELDAGGDPQAVRRSLRQIARSSQSAAHLVNQLLAMARAEDRGGAQRVADVPLVRIAKEVVLDFVPRALDKRIDLGYEGLEFELAAPRFTGHPVLVRELVRNLVDNALHYTPPGGTVTVRLDAEPAGGGYRLQVEDTGPGIDEAEREQVFQPFYRGLGTDVDGSGLGLAIVKEIADRHGAQVDVTATRIPVPGSGESPGARFAVRFPCPGAAPSTETTTQP